MKVGFNIMFKPLPQEARVHVDDDGNHLHADAEILEDYKSLSQFGDITNENRDSAVSLLKKYYSDNTQLKNLDNETIGVKVLEFKNYVDREPHLVWRRMKELDLGLFDQHEERLEEASKSYEEKQMESAQRWANGQAQMVSRR